MRVEWSVRATISSDRTGNCRLCNGHLIGRACCPYSRRPSGPWTIDPGRIDPDGVVCQRASESNCPRSSPMTAQLPKANTEIGAPGGRLLVSRELNLGVL